MKEEELKKSDITQKLEWAGKLQAISNRSDCKPNPPAKCVAWDNDLNFFMLDPIAIGTARSQGTGGVSTILFSFGFWAAFSFSHHILSLFNRCILIIR